MPLSPTWSVWLSKGWMGVFLGSSYGNRRQFKQTTAFRKQSELRWNQSRFTTYLLPLNTCHWNNLSALFLSSCDLLLLLKLLLVDLAQIGSDCSKPPHNGGLNVVNVFCKVLNAIGLMTCWLMINLGNGLGNWRIWIDLHKDVVANTNS